jgi:hypothetical protein
MDPEALSRLELYFDVGDEDHLGFQMTSTELSATLAGRGIPHTFSLRPGGHGDSFTSANLPRSLSFLVRCLGEQLAVTYCPLTGSSIVFDRASVDGDEFGVSGFLWQNNLIMYNRRTRDRESKDSTSP